MAETAPRVSVVMPAYNAARWISRSIESVLTQTFTDLELILVDDGSTDATAELMAAAAQRDHRIRYEVREHAGVAATSNRCIQLAQGEYVARLDSDDIAVPDRIAQQVTWLDDHPNTAVLGGWVITIDGNDRKQRPQRYVTSLRNKQSTIARPRAINHSTSMARRRILLEIGGYRSTFDYVEDYDLWLRIYERANLENLPVVLAYYRLHRAQTSQRYAFRQAGLALLAQAVAKIRRRGEADPIHEGFIADTSSVRALGLDDETVTRIVDYLEQAQIVESQA